MGALGFGRVWQPGRPREGLRLDQGAACWTVGSPISVLETLRSPPLREIWQAASSLLCGVIVKQEFASPSQTASSQHQPVDLLAEELGMPVGPLNDRTTLNMPLSQAPLLLLLSQVLSAAAP